jgi:hypothetical protein
MLTTTTPGAQLASAECSAVTPSRAAPYQGGGGQTGVMESARAREITLDLIRRLRPATSFGGSVMPITLCSERLS